MPSSKRAGARLELPQPISRMELLETIFFFLKCFRIRGATSSWVPYLNNLSEWMLKTKHHSKALPEHCVKKSTQKWSVLNWAGAWGRAIELSKLIKSSLWLGDSECFGSSHTVTHTPTHAHKKTTMAEEEPEPFSFHKSKVGAILNELDAPPEYTFSRFEIFWLMYYNLKFKTSNPMDLDFHPKTNCAASCTVSGDVTW